MKILYVLPTLYRGGAEKSTLFLASQMKSVGHNVSLLAFRGGELLEEFRVCGISVTVKATVRDRLKGLIPEQVLSLYYGTRRRRAGAQFATPAKLSPPSPDPSLENWFKAHVRSLAPDVVHVHQSSCVEALAWAKECGVPRIVFSPHEIISEVSDEFDLKRIGQFAPRADWITFVSFAQRKDFLQRISYPAARTGVIYPQTSFVGRTVEATRSPPPLVVGTISNLSPPKDPMTLLRAISALRRRQMDVQLLIGGGDPRWKPAVEQAARDTGIQKCVAFLGTLSTNAQLQEFFSAIDVYVSTSVTESFGLALREAMECGRAVVSADVLPVRELVDESRTGLIFRRGDSEGLASALAQFFDHPDRIRTMGLRGRKRFEKEFAASTGPMEIGRIYEENVGIHTRRAKQS